MENSEILQKLENIEILLTANIESMNDPQKRAKEAESFIQASNELNTTSKEIKGFLAQQKRLIEGFKPTVEHKHYTVDMKNPLYWVLGSLLCCGIAIFLMFYYEGKYEAEKVLTEQYKSESDLKDSNYMKYKYLEFFGNDYTVHFLKELDKDYAKNMKKLDSKVNNFEQALDKAERARKEAELKAGESKRLQQHVDSLQGQEK